MLHAQIAQTILDGFDVYRERFKQITDGAQARFEQAQWQEIQRTSAERIDLYEEKVAETVARVGSRFSPAELLDVERWPLIKSAYIALIDPRNDDELAETWFNSIFCGLFSHDNISDGTMFVHTTRPSLRPHARDPHTASTGPGATCARRCSRSSPTTASRCPTRTPKATWRAWTPCCTATCRTGCARTRSWPWS